MTYYDLWNILWSWRREFTIKEFRSTFPSPSPNKVLHDMVQKGFLDRVNWGRYRVNSPKEYVGKKFNIIEAYELVNEAGLEYAFTGPDAVFFWTKGGYNIDRFFAFYPIHLKINKQELVSWKNFFKFKGKRVHVYGEPVKETLYGVFYVLYSESETRAEKVDGYSVMPLDETIEFCRKNIYAYEPALEMLDEMYNLKLGIRYQEKETNL
ncbi:MAG: hypothetical protein ACUVXA_18715 [Candidatus Jordarchaeum sp.]|uniref:hypothetical protein n=1 Tax=Candidatus Jordarchaeum sp. TaxID=2823881 RepID=UPI00404B52F4